MMRDVDLHTHRTKYTKFRYFFPFRARHMMQIQISNILFFFARCSSSPLRVPYFFPSLFSLFLSFTTQHKT